MSTTPMGTHPAARAPSASDACVVGLRLSRNFGHQSAVLAGLLTAAGEAVITIDADLQDDLAAITKMLDRYQEGCDIVYGVRAQRLTDTAFKRRTALVYYDLLKRFGVNVVHNHADYRLMGRKAVDALKEFGEVNLFLRGLVPLIGLKSAKVYYDRKQRIAGKSKYDLDKNVAARARWHNLALCGAAALCLSDGDGRVFAITGNVRLGPLDQALY